MKRLWCLVLLAGVVQPVFAEEPPPKHTHISWEERFKEANTTNDGHMTLEQAKTGYKTVARHFHNIDVDGKGYVTENDIRAWHAQQKANRHSQATPDPLRPRPAFNRYAPEQQRGTRGPNQTMLMPPTAQVPAMISLDRPVQAH